MRSQYAILARQLVVQFWQLVVAPSVNTDVEIWQEFLLQQSILQGNKLKKRPEGRAKVNCRIYLNSPF